MALGLNLFLILLLILVSAFFSISEISLAASRKVKLRLLADAGEAAAERVLMLQANPALTPAEVWDALARRGCLDKLQGRT